MILILIVVLAECVRGHAPLIEFYPCTVAQEQAQDKWFEASRKCWRGENLPTVRQKCFDKIRPPFK